jgi:hypothetical protein
MASCSLIAIQRPPSAEAPSALAAPISCTDGLTYPLVDTAGTILAGVLAVSLLAGDSDGELKTASYASGGVGIGLAASAIYGLFQVNRCRDAKRQSGDPGPGDTAPNEDREAPGTHGGRCNPGGECEDDLYCDEPMQVCIPLNPREGNR